MTMYDLICKKQRGEALSDAEIEFIVNGYTCDAVPDYQMSAFLMAVLFRGMTDGETAALTYAMMRSGDTVDLGRFGDLTVDKHSTGGGGDKTTLIVAPIAAACGLKVAKMSGRGLGHTGGTVDKLESIPGYRTVVSMEEFLDQVDRVGLHVIAQSGNLAPADKKIYALRDVTATVNSMPLIVSSIMSKKLASGADAIVLDVKTGDGAFMKTLNDSVALAEAMVSIGKLAGKKMAAIISDMDQPLGNAVGNILEVKEAIDTLQGNGPKDLEDLVLTLGSYMVVAAEKADTIDEARRMLEETLRDGSAFEVFKKFVVAQGGCEDEVLHPEKLPVAQYIEDVVADTGGYVVKIQTEEIGRISLLLGGGRETKDSEIDLTVGVVLNKKRGDRFEKGDVLATIHANDKEKLKQAKKHIIDAYRIADDTIAKESLIKKIIV